MSSWLEPWINCGWPAACSGRMYPVPPTSAAVYHVEQATDVVDPSAVWVWCLSLAARWWTWVTPPMKPGCRSTSPSLSGGRGCFSMLRFCAETIFPAMDHDEEPHVQNISRTSTRTTSCSITPTKLPRAGALNSGRRNFVNQKKLLAGQLHRVPAQGGQQGPQPTSAPTRQASVLRQGPLE